MGVIQRQIEAAGIATVSISLLRRFSEHVVPPRALWVPFPFGRPLGAPRNVPVQRLVILSAVRLLERTDTPVLEDLMLPPNFEHLDARHQALGRKCGASGCSLDALLAGATEGEDPTTKPYDRDFAALAEELRGRVPKHDEYRKLYRGRTQVGFSGAKPETIMLTAETVHRFICGEMISPPTLPSGERPLMNNYIRLCVDDLKAYFLESRLAEDENGAENVSLVNDWLWLDTRMGSMLVAARDRLIETTDRSVDPNWIVARGIVPRGYGSNGYTMSHVREDS